MRSSGYDRGVNTFSPEGRFGHYLLMASALGGRDWKWPGVAMSDYENAAGTGNVQMWFPANH